MMLLSLAACSSPKESSKKEVEQVLKASIASELSTADVSLAMDNTACEVMSQVAEGLYSFDIKGNAIPALAEEKVTPTEEGLRYTFKIRKGAKWSNGEEITAKDFVYSWQRTVDPKTTSPQAFYFSGIENYAEISEGKKQPSELGVKATDDYTLEVKLAYPMSYFQQLLAVPAFFPLNQAFVEKEGAKYGTNATSTLYNGAFTLKDWDGTSMSWTYEKNNQYWDKKNVKLEKVQMQVVKEVGTGKNLFDDGKLDEVAISGEVVAQEKANKALHIRELPGTYYVELNTQKKLFANKNARKAMSLALDSEKLAKNVLNDGSQKALGFVPAGFVNQETQKDFAKEVGDINPHDSKEAKKLWEEAKKELGVTKAEFTILCSDAEGPKKVSEYIQGALSETLDGLSISISPVPFANRLEKSRSGDFDVVLGGWTPVYADPIDFLNLLQSENSNNFGKWKNTAFDQYVEQANVTYANDYQKRWEAMKSADKLISEEVPLIPLYQISEAHLINSKVKGLEFGPLGSAYYKNVEIVK